MYANFCRVTAQFSFSPQSDKCTREFCHNFATKLVAMATSLKISEKSQTDHLQINTYHRVQRLWKSVQQIMIYFHTERTSLLRYKIGCHSNDPWGIEKKFRSIICTQNAFIWWKNCRNCTWFVFCLRHKVGCHGNVPWGIGKTGLDEENSRKYRPFIIIIIIIIIMQFLTRHMSVKVWRNRRRGRHVSYGYDVV